MDVRKQIITGTTKVVSRNQHNTEQYRKKVKDQLRVNIVEKGQSVESNQHLVDRFYGAKPQGLTSMQQALLDAAGEES